jgi:hypothetical protein
VPPPLLDAVPPPLLDAVPPPLLDAVPQRGVPGVAPKSSSRHRL